MKEANIEVSRIRGLMVSVVAVFAPISFSLHLLIFVEPDASNRIHSSLSFVVLNQHAYLPYQLLSQT
jgi:hypothetical protein